MLSVILFLAVFFLGIIQDNARLRQIHQLRRDLRALESADHPTASRTHQTS